MQMTIEIHGVEFEGSVDPCCDNCTLTLRRVLTSRVWSDVLREWIEFEWRT